jgi:hypothetical protein
LRLPVDHSWRGTERRRTHPYNARKRPSHSRKSWEAQPSRACHYRDDGTVIGIECSARAWD